MSISTNLEHRILAFVSFFTHREKRFFSVETMVGTGPVICELAIFLFIRVTQREYRGRNILMSWRR